MHKNYLLVVGISADPVHEGHINLIVESTKALLVREISLTKIMIIPVYRRNPVCSKHKNHLPFTFEHRFAMCELAAKEIHNRLQGKVDRVVVSKIEEKLAKSRQKPNYTAETLEIIREVIDIDTGLIFLLGEDVLSGANPQLGKWYKPEKIIQLATLALCPRWGYKRNMDFLEKLQNQGAQFIYLDEVATKNIASSQIKPRLKAGEDPLTLNKEGLLSEDVALYIKDHHLADFWRKIESTEH